MMNKKHKPGQNKGLSLRIPGVIVTVLIAGLLFSWWIVVQADRDMRAELLEKTRLVSAAINIDRVEALSGTEADLNSPNYQRLKEQFITLRTAYPQSRFLYLLGRRADGTIFFFLDSEPAESKDYSPPGQVYGEANEAYRSVFATRTSVVDGPITDRWGTWVSALVPIHDPQTAISGLATPNDAQAMVQRAVDYYRKNGKERLLKEINNPQGEFCKGDLYAFAYDSGMTMQAHPVKPELVGKNQLDMKDWTGGKYFRKEIKEVALTKGAGWVDYEYENPANKQRDPKTTYVERIDDLIICAGAYKGSGAILAVLGMDIDAREWNWALARAALPSVICAVALTIILLTGSVLFTRRSRIDGTPSHWMRHLELGLVFSVGLILTLFAAWTTHEQETRGRNKAFAQQMTSQTKPIATTLHTLRDIEIEGLSNFYERSEDVTVDEFRKFTTYLTKNPAVSAWEWIPAVPAADKAGFEATARLAGLTDFAIWQKDDQGKRVPVIGRELYYPVLQIAPLVGNERAPGFDLGSEPLRRTALEEAIRSGLSTATDPLILLQETGTQKGMLIYRPVFAGDGSRRLRGFALAVLRMDNLLRSAVLGDTASLELSLLSKGATSETLATTWNSDSAITTGVSWMSPVLAFSKVFCITAHAGPQFMKLYPIRAGWLSILIGLSLTTAITYILRLVLSRQEELERIVAARTLQLQESEQSYRNQFANNSAIMLMIDPGDNAIIDANAAAVAFYGYPKEQLLTMRITDINTLLASDVRKAISSIVSGLSKHFEFQHRLADGSLRDVEVSSSNIHFSGRILLHSIVQDITDRKRAEKKLQESELLQRQLLASLPTGIVIVDPVTRIIEQVNDHVATLFGAPVEHLVGHRCHSLLCPAGEGACPVCDLGQLVDNSDQQMLRADGTHLAILKTVKRISVNGEDKLLECFVDISKQKNAEENLKMERKRLSGIIEGTHVGTWEWNIQTGETIFNNRWAEIIGYSLDEISPVSIETWVNFSHPDDLLKSGKLLDRHFCKELDYYECESRMKHKNGQWVWVLDRGKVTSWDEEGKPLLMQGTHQDITERKQVEMELEKVTERLALATEAGGVGVWDYDVVKNKLVWDDQMFRIYGITRDHFGSGYKAWKAALHPEDRQRADDEIQLALQGENDVDTELRTIWPDGTIHNVRAQAFVQRDASGNALRIIGTNWDITAQKQAEEEQKASKELLSLILNSVAEAIYGIDTYGCCTFCNQACLALLGYDHQEDLLGKNIHSLIHHTLPDGSPLPEHNCRIYKAFQLGEGTHADDEILWRKDGSSFPAEYWSFPQRTLGEIVGAVVTFFDITKRKLFEEQLIDARDNADMANAAKSEFLASMSHEIRTPMNGVIGMTGLLLDTQLDDEQRRYAEIVRSSGESLLGLINDILDFSKIEAKKLELEILDFDLSYLLDDFTATIAIRAQEKGLELLCDSDYDVPMLLRGDPGRLRQILANLTDNAVKFTQSGEVAICVSLTEKNENDVLLRFSVRDTGIGIPANKIHQLFNKFSQMDASTTRKYGGTGLGLAISKQLVELMGGETGVISEEGKGSEFWFSVRLGKQAEDSPHENISLANLQNVRVIIVDDNATNCEIQTKRLASWGMRPAEAHDGHEALRCLYDALDKNDPFAIAVIDMQMPGMDGEILGRTIKADKRLADIQMVMLTSMGTRGDARHFEEIGFAAYATKPIRHQELKTILSLVLADPGQVQTFKPIVTRHTAHETTSLFPGYTVRILLAEDNITNQRVAMGILKKFGLRADVVANGAEVIKALEILPYDLILMDVQMPEMDGLEATGHIRNRQSAAWNHDIPIIAMTANAMQGDREVCLHAGMNDYVSKPVSPQTLAETLKKWLPNETLNTRGQSSVTPEKSFSIVAQDSELPVFDRAGMLNRLMDDEELLQVVVEGFLGDIPVQIEALKGFMENGDIAATERQAHTIKGASANVGGETLRAVACEMEKAAKAGDMATVKTHIGELVTQFEYLKKAMTN